MQILSRFPTVVIMSMVAVVSAAFAASEASDSSGATPSRELAEGNNETKNSNATSAPCLTTAANACGFDELRPSGGAVNAVANSHITVTVDDIHVAKGACVP